MDRLEFGPFRDELEEQLQALTEKLASLQRIGDDNDRALSEDEAAGIRKQLLQSFNCISCDKPVQMMPRKYVFWGFHEIKNVLYKPLQSFGQF